MPYTILSTVPKKILRAAWYTPQLFQKRSSVHYVASVINVVIRTSKIKYITESARRPAALAVVALNARTKRGAKVKTLY